MKTQIWSAIHTPFLSDGGIDETGVRKNVEEYIERGIHGVFCNGLMGENWSLSADERVEHAKIIIDQAEMRLKTCAVATLGTEEETIALGKRYKETGMDYTCLCTPGEKQSKDSLVAYFNRLMDAIDMPIVVFNAVTLEGSVLTPEVFQEICKNKHLKLLKTTASDEVNHALRAVAGPGVLCSDPTEEKFFKNATQQGQQILFADPEPYLYQTVGFRPIEAYTRLIEEGEFEEARRIFDALAPLRIQYNKWLMVPFYKGVRICAYLKKWAELNGLVGGEVREPLIPLTQEEALCMEKDIKASWEEVRKVLGEEIL